MITSITKEQEAKLPEYLERWRNIGLRTQTVDRDKAIDAIKALYKVGGFKIPEDFYFFPNIHVATEVAELLQQGVIKHPKEYNPTTKYEYTKSGIINNCSWANINAYWVSTYSFAFNEILERNELIEVAENVCNHCPPYYMFDECVVFSDFPESLSFTNEVLHNPEGPAYKGRGGYNIYALNGIRVPEWVITTPKHLVKGADILAIKNVEVRLQAMKHVGLSNIMDSMQYRVLDVKDKYRLLMINIEGSECEFLEMVNPSTYEVVIEGVEPGTKTVKDAMKFRFGGLELVDTFAFEA